MYDASKGIFSTKSDSQFIKLITTVIISNVLGSAIIPIFNLYFLENKWQNFSYGQTLLILNTTMILGNILGSLFPKDFFSRLSLKKILVLELYSFALIGIFSFLKFPFIFILFVFSFNCFLVGKFNPKFSATLMTNVPDNMLAQVSSFISFLVMISIPIGTSVFSMIYVFNSNILWILFLSLTIIGLYFQVESQ